MFFDKTKFEKIGTLTNTGSSDLVFGFPQRAQVKRVLLITTTAATVAGTVTVKKNGTAIGSFSAGVIAAHAGVFADIGHDGGGDTDASDGSVVNKGGVSFIEFDAGDYISLTPADVANTGVFDAYIEYIPEGLVDEDDSGLTKAAYTVA